tara:strand:- start:180 stop:1313 length:1134 start_codon:yes stop_codon:yes gene_type:complete
MKKIAIIGGGISGLYFANLLQKNQNYSYTIFEKKTNFDLNDGYGIQLSVNSIKLLNEIGFSNIEASSVSFPKKVIFYDARSSKKICDIEISKFNDANSRYTTLKRSTLFNFLLDKVPNEKIIYNSELVDVTIEKKINLKFSDNHKEAFDYLVASDGVFSKSKSIIINKDSSPKYFNSVALRGSIKNFTSKEISLFLGSNFHFVIYPVNQNNEFNFISIIRRKLKKEQINDQNYFQNSNFIESLINEISLKTSIKFKDKVQNLKSFPIFISNSFNQPNNKNIFLVGDALYALPPSFAQGASQSIESSKEAFDEIENNTDNYYQKRNAKIKNVNSRSMFNHFAFHLSNPFTIFVRNIFLRYLSKNKKFLENYLGKIYNN